MAKHYFPGRILIALTYSMMRHWFRGDILGVSCSGETNISSGQTRRGCWEANVLGCARYLLSDILVLASPFYLGYVPGMNCINKLLCFLVSIWVPTEQEFKGKQEAKIGIFLFSAYSLLYHTFQGLCSSKVIVLVLWPFLMATAVFPSPDSVNLSLPLFLQIFGPH